MKTNYLANYYLDQSSSPVGVHHLQLGLLSMAGSSVPRNIQRRCCFDRRGHYKRCYTVRMGHW